MKCQVREEGPHVPLVQSPPVTGAQIRVKRWEGISLRRRLCDLLTGLLKEDTRDSLEGP